MNRAQAVDLANTIHWIQPTWDQPGIITALLRSEGTYGAIALHAIRVALNPASRNPGAINATPIPEPTTDQRPDKQELVDQATARQRAIDHCTRCDQHGRINSWLCDHDPDRPTRNAAARAAARANLRPTRTTPDQEQP